MGVLTELSDGFDAQGYREMIHAIVFFFVFNIQSLYISIVFWINIYWACILGQAQAKSRD